MLVVEEDHELVFKSQVDVIRLSGEEVIGNPFTKK